MHKPSADSPRESASRLTLEVLEDRRLLSLLGLSAVTATLEAPVPRSFTEEVPPAMAAVVPQTTAPLAQLPATSNPAADPSVSALPLLGPVVADVAPGAIPFLVQALAVPTALGNQAAGAPTGGNQGLVGGLGSSLSVQGLVGDLTGAVNAVLNLSPVLNLGVSVTPATGAASAPAGLQVGVDAVVLGTPLLEFGVSPSVDGGATGVGVGLGTQVAVGTAAPVQLRVGVGADGVSSVPGGAGLTVSASASVDPVAGPSVQASTLVGPAVAVGVSVPTSQANGLIGPITTVVAEPAVNAGHLANAAIAPSVEGVDAAHVAGVARPANPSASVGVPATVEPAAGASTAVQAPALQAATANAADARAPVDPAAQSSAGVGAPPLLLTEFVRTEPTGSELVFGEIAAAREQAGLAGQLVVSPLNPAPESTGLLVGGSADLNAMERALQQFLNQVAALPGEVSGWLNRVGPVPWVLVGVAIAGLGHELGRRRKKRRAGVSGVSGDDAETLTWVSGMARLGEGS
jgi:hypothetical protein